MLGRSNGAIGVGAATDAIGDGAATDLVAIGVGVAGAGIGAGAAAAAGDIDLARPPGQFDSLQQLRDADRIWAKRPVRIVISICLHTASVMLHGIKPA